MWDGLPTARRDKSHTAASIFMPISAAYRATQRHDAENAAPANSDTSMAVRF
jgi:hypothetical protein